MTEIILVSLAVATTITTIVLVIFWSVKKITEGNGIVDTIKGTIGLTLILAFFIASSLYKQELDQKNKNNIQQTEKINK